MHVRKRLYCLEETAGRNMDIKGDSGEISDGNEEHVFGIWRKGNPHFKVTKHL